MQEGSGSLDRGRLSGFDLSFGCKSAPHPVAHLWEKALSLEHSGGGWVEGGSFFGVDASSRKKVLKTNVGEDAHRSTFASFFCGGGG
jgi:hypothetical protein